MRAGLVQRDYRTELVQKSMLSSARHASQAAETAEVDGGELMIRGDEILGAVDIKYPVTGKAMELDPETRTRPGSSEEHLLV